MKDPAFHPLCDLFPALSDEEFGDLVADMKVNGQLHPILKAGDQIVDGRHRFLACKKLGIKPVFTEWDGKTPLRELSISLNIRRRHMTTSERTGASALVSELFEADPALKLERGRSAERAAAMFKVSPANVYKALAVKRASPATFEMIRTGKLTVHQATREVQRQHRTKTLDRRARSLPTVDAGACDLRASDCRAFLETLPRMSAKLVFVDPPYNCGIDYGNGRKADQMSPEAYIAWCESWLNECSRVLALGGAIFFLIDGRWACRTGELLDAMFARRNLIVWHETFGNYTDENFSPCARFLHYHVKGNGDGYSFHSDAVRVPSDRQEKYADKRANKDGKVPGNVWQFPRLVDNAAERVPGFPTQVPVALVERVVLATTEAGDLVVDCFSGSGTTAVAAVRHGRRFAGCDLNAKYVKTAKQRVAVELAGTGTGGK